MRWPYTEHLYEWCTDLVRHGSSLNDPTGTRNHLRIRTAIVQDIVTALRLGRLESFSRSLTERRIYLRQGHSMLLDLSSLGRTADDYAASKTKLMRVDKQQSGVLPRLFKSGNID